MQTLFIEWKCSLIPFRISKMKIQVGNYHYHNGMSTKRFYLYLLACRSISPGLHRERKSGSRQNFCHLLMVLKYKQNSSWAGKVKAALKKKKPTWLKEDLKDRIGQSHFVLFGQSKNIYYGKSKK